jgi:hypothetical protein
MFPWPNIELTDYERKFVRIYKTKDKPGVLNRRYKITLNSQAAPDQNLPVVKTSGQIQIARRSRVYGLSFIGNTDRWRLSISTASGTQYTNKSPRGQLDPIVSSLVPGNYNNALSLGGLVPPLAPAGISPGIGPALGYEANGLLVQGFQPFPLIIDPNWLLMPNETLIFSGTPVDVPLLFNQQTITPMLTLTIIAHVWEFPVMGTAPASERQVT